MNMKACAILAIRVVVQYPSHTIRLETSTGLVWMFHIILKEIRVPLPAGEFLWDVTASKS